MQRQAANERAQSAKSQVDLLLKAIPGAACRVEYWDGECRDYGGGAPFVLRLTDPDVVGKVLADLLIGLPEAYVNGDLHISGDLQALLRLCYRLNPGELRLSPAQRIGLVVNAIRQRNTVRGSGRNVARHYDLGNEFFRLWLDREMVYSCAYYQANGDSLEVAQRRKLEFVCRKLELVAGQRLLDIGCGWGALITHAAGRHGVSAVGITRSQAQFEWCRERLAPPGLALGEPGPRVQVRLQDYRELADAPYDRVVSIGMLEHVGRNYLDTYLATLARCLRPGGVGVLQWISKNEPGELTPWILLRIFPGMYLPTLAQVSSGLAAHGLRLLDAENLRPHYALTLDAWAARFEAQAQPIETLLGAPFVRMWRMYLNAASVAFKVGDLNLWQLRFSRGLGDNLPLTRGHWYRPAQPA